MNKRGISAITLTTLLILFAITFGILMMYLSKQPALQLETCTVNVNLQIPKILGEELLCQTPNSLKFTLQNGAATDIDSLIINFNGESVTISERIKKASSHVSEIPITQKVENLEIIPIIPEIGECKNSAIKVKEIVSC